MEFRSAASLLENPLEPPLAARGRRIGAMLRAKLEPTNNEFDELYPFPIRTISTTFWTPVDIALRAAKRLVNRSGCRVLDIGSGAGKFCNIGALATEGAFFGIEQREQLVECARDTASLLGSAATFTHGVFGNLNPLDYDAFYLFNPFGENTFSSMEQIDTTVELTRERFASDVRLAQEFLGAAKPGARVVTYNGMGGKLPHCYTLVQREDFGCGIDLWVKDLPGA